VPYRRYGGAVLSHRTRQLMGRDAVAQADAQPAGDPVSSPTRMNWAGCGQFGRRVPQEGSRPSTGIVLSKNGMATPARRGAALSIRQVYGGNRSSSSGVGEKKIRRALEPFHPEPHRLREFSGWGDILSLIEKSRSRRLTRKKNPRTSRPKGPLRRWFSRLEGLSATSCGK